MLRGPCVTLCSWNRIQPAAQASLCVQIVSGSWSSGCNPVKNLETFDLCYWKWNQEVSPHFPSHVRDVSPAVSPQGNSLQHKKHKKSKESGIWTSYFTRLSRKTPLLPVFFPFLFWPKNTCENGLLQTLNMSCGKLRNRTKYQPLAGQLLLSVSDKTRHQRFFRTLKNTGEKTIINRL